MVAISLYRGNMHRVPDVPRRWLMPRPTISLKDFRHLIGRRNKTLSSATPTSTVSNPNPDSSLNHCAKQQGEVVEDNECSKQIPIPTTESPHNIPNQQQDNNSNSSKEEAPPLPGQEQQRQRAVIDAQDQVGSKSDLRIELPKGVDEFVSSPDTKSVLPTEENCCLKSGGDHGTSQALQEENLPVYDQPNVKVSENFDLPSEKEKKKRELEEKLEVLNGRKHNLVQMLKQILNAEEEMKRRNSMQVSGIRPPVSLQVEATTTSDLGSSPRQNVARVGSEANLSGDLEGESEDVSTHHAHARHFQHMRSTSPSASSPRRKNTHSSLQPNAVLHPSRATQSTSSTLLGGVTASPSRFAPTGAIHQGIHPPNLPPPPVSVSGTHFMASSPSPAASGGTSVFRDSRLTSP